MRGDLSPFEGIAIGSLIGIAFWALIVWVGVLIT